MIHAFKLFVSGDTPRARHARAALQRLCEAYLEGRYEIEVVDVTETPEEAEAHHIIVTPVIMKLRPPPARRAVGDLRDTERVISVLQLQSHPH